MSGDLLFIVGPTASGKTALSLEMAEYLGADILSCDSLCFYKGMDIGTAKPTIEEQSRVRHHGIDLVFVRHVYSVGNYIEYCKGIIEKAKLEKKPLVITGGSGFYLKSFFSSVTDGVVVSEEILAVVEEIKQNSGLAGLVGRLKEISGGSGGIGDLDMWNCRRVEKALARCLAANKSHIELEYIFREQPEPYKDLRKRVVLIERDKEELKKRNLLRVEHMMKNGLVDEVARLRQEGLEENVSARRAIGYRETLAYLDNEMDYETLVATIWRNTNQLMRKQRAWFKNQILIHTRVDGDLKNKEKVKDLLGRVEWFH